VVSGAVTPAAAATFTLAAQAGLLAGPFLSMVDSNIVNVAIPDIARELQTQLATAQWVVSGYLLALAAMLAASAFLAKRFGTRRVYLASRLGFTITSGLCALAPSIEVLIALPALQSATGAPLVPLAMSMLLGGGSDRRMPPAAGIVLFLAPALGPALGGLLIPVAGWPAIFLVNVPVGIVGCLGMRRDAPQISDKADPSVQFDPDGLLLLALGLTLALYGAAEGPVIGWMAAGAWPFWAAGALLICLYVPSSSRRSHPAVDLRLLLQSPTAIAVGLSSLASVVMFVMLFLTPIFLESVQRMSPLQAGLALLPQGLATGLGTVLGEKLPAKYGVRRSVAVGMGILSVSTAALLLVRVDSPGWLIAAILSGRGLALGLTIQPLLHAQLSGLNSAQIANGTALFNVAQRLGGSIGISPSATFFQIRERVQVERVVQEVGLPTPVLDSGQGSPVSAGMAYFPAPVQQALAQAATAGFHDVIGLLVVLAVLGTGGALLLRNRDSRQHVSPVTTSAA
jgi:EmrB/QacA subfamily drug resistance transporter